MAHVHGAMMSFSEMFDYAQYCDFVEAQGDTWLDVAPRVLFCTWVTLEGLALYPALANDARLWEND